MENKLKCPGVGRDGENDRVLVFYFSRCPSDDEMRYLHEVMERATACNPYHLNYEAPALKLVKP